MMVLIDLSRSRLCDPLRVPFQSWKLPLRRRPRLNRDTRHGIPEPNRLASPEGQVPVQAVQLAARDLDLPEPLAVLEQERDPEGGIISDSPQNCPVQDALRSSLVPGPRVRPWPPDPSVGCDR